MSLPFELTSLSNAKNYQKWIYSSVFPYLGNRILELGAGIGNLSQWLPKRELLILSEADPELITILNKKFYSDLQNPSFKIKKINLDDSLANQLGSEQIDTIVSFNVMEHIEDDEKSFKDQLAVLKNNSKSAQKRLVIFAPAHQFAFGSYDQVFKHYRRYEYKKLVQKLKKLEPTAKIEAFHFNLLSLPAWIWNGRVKKSTQFEDGQIQFLDKIIPFWAPVDYLLHKIFRIPLGQSLVVVVTL